MACELKGRSILITGATSGIGRNTARYLTKNCGAEVVLIGRSRENLAALQIELGESCGVIAADLNDLSEIAQIFAVLRDRGQQLDGMVHCAGVSPLMKVEENDIERMLETYRVNVLSFIELVKYFQDRSCARGGGSIVAMSSIAAQYASWRQTVYAGSKAALEESVRCIAKELLSSGIRVNCVAAGAVETEMLQKLETQSTSLREKLEKVYPLGVIEPDCISEMIAYLLSDSARYITGSIIRVDSGFAVAK